MQSQSTQTEVFNFSPPVHLDTLDLPQGKVFVAREDLLPGGTKQRASAPLLQSLSAKGYRHFAYASPFCGFAQVALAYVCSVLKLRCEVFAEAHPKTQAAHEFTKLAEHYGARVTLVPSLAIAEKAAREWADFVSERYQIPLGFQCPKFLAHFEMALTEEWARVVQKLGRAPKRVWLPVGSGTLASVFEKIVGPQVELNCINVNLFRLTDSRFDRLNHDPRVRFRSAAEAFHERSMYIPPVPSNVHYDAKLWSFITREAQEGDLWWNVAK